MSSLSVVGGGEGLTFSPPSPTVKGSGIPDEVLLSAVNGDAVNLFTEGNMEELLSDEQCAALADCSDKLQEIIHFTVASIRRTPEGNLWTFVLLESLVKEAREAVTNSICGGGRKMLNRPLPTRHD
jgi:hypothetical protein